MAEGDSPTVARRRVRLAIREARDAAGLTQGEVAEATEWSHSKVIRIENGEVSISPNDLRPLFNYFRGVVPLRLSP
jgi:transcriptional regulator with XRE-family HTH domain